MESKTERINTNDVRNRKLLEKYHTIVNEIRRMLVDESDNSIQSMIHTLNWNDTIYRTFNEGIRLMWKHGLQDKLPGTLIEYIDRAHLGLVLSILRKIYEPKKKGNRSVNSIPTIIRYMQAHVGCWTRENYVSHDGTPYSTNNDYDWKVNYTVECRHKIFDHMCATNKKRSRMDILNPNILTIFEKKAVFNKDLEKYANNFLFHAAATKARPNEEETYSIPILNKVQAQAANALWIILQVGKIADQLVLTKVATPQFDPLDAWDQSLFTIDIKMKLEKYWRRRVNWWSKWTDCYWQDFNIYISPRKIFVPV